MAIPWHLPQRRRWQPWRMLLVTETGSSIPNFAHLSTTTAEVAAFEAFVQRYERLILNYLWRMTGEEQSAYDLLQETFLRAWEQFTKIAYYQNPRAWLFRVATNLALSLRARRQGPVGRALSLDATNDPGASDPARHVVESELVRQTLQTLAPRSRAMLVLREVYGLSIEEIAGVLEMTHNAVKMGLCRAREQFRSTYEREERQP